MKHKKIVSLLTALATAVCCTVSAAYTAKNTVPIETTAAVSVFDEYREWKQFDERWSTVPMGYYSVRSVGCLLTSLAMMAVRSGSIDDRALDNMGIDDVEDFNPGVLAKAYSKNNGFSWGGAIQSWYTIEKIIPNIEWGWDTYFNSVSKSAVADELRDLMADGYHIVARVNNGGSHWVYIENVEPDDSITMCDPARYTHDLYEAYPNGLHGEYWAVKGTNPPGFGYEPSLEMELTLPKKLEYKYGEELDLSGGKVKLSGVHPTKGEWSSKAVAMNSSDGSFTINTKKFDSETPGEYEITVKAETPYASAKDSFFVTVDYPTGEYFVSKDTEVMLMSGQGEGSVQYVLKTGYVINITDTTHEYGYMESSEISGWVDMSRMEKTVNCIHKNGDINNDDIIDKYDLALLNLYLEQKEQLPKGISMLTASQLEAADLNDDGKVNQADVDEYLLIVSEEEE